MSAPDLLPCPFCNANILDLRSPGMDGNPRYRHPIYAACPIAGHMFGGEVFAELWNRTAPDPTAMAARITKLEAALKPIAEAADGRRRRDISGGNVFPQPMLLAARDALAGKDK